MRRRALRANLPILVSFIAGLALGLGMQRAGNGLSMIQRVSGVDGETTSAGRKDSLAKIDPDTAQQQPIPRRVISSAPEPAAGAPPAAASPAQAPSASAVGKSALEFTAFVRSGSYYGAGVLLDAAGHIVTCNHVLDQGATTARVSFHDEGPFVATVLDSDADRDLALLHVEGLAREPARPAGISGVRMGDEVYGVGAPRKLRFSMSRGIVSYVGRRFDSLYYLQTDLPTNSGNSGGPVLNDRGEVLAIAAFIYRDSVGLAFALPLDYVYERFSAYLDRGQPLTRFSRWKQAVARRPRPR